MENLAKISDEFNLGERGLDWEQLEKSESNRHKYCIQWVRVVENQSKSSKRVKSK